MKLKAAAFLLLFTSFIAVGNKPAEGYIITVSNDTLQVTFSIPVFNAEASFRSLPDPDLVSLQFGCKYYHNDKKKYFKTADVKEFHFNYRNESYTFFARASNLGLYKMKRGARVYYHEVFFRLIEPGKLKLFQFYYYRRVSRFTDDVTQTIRFIELLQKEDSPLFQPGAEEGFYERMSDYMHDCPVIIEKLKTKEFCDRDVDKIVRFYNKGCEGPTVTDASVTEEAPANK